MNYTRLRNFDIRNLLSYELTSIPFYLSNEYGFLNKSTKSEFAREIQNKLLQLLFPYVPKNEEGEVGSMLAIDFMTYARKVQVKKLSIKTFMGFPRKLDSNILFLIKKLQQG